MPVYKRCRRDELERGDVFRHNPGGHFAVVSNDGRRYGREDTSGFTPYLCVYFRLNTSSWEIVQRDESYSHTNGDAVVEHIGKAVFKPNSDVVESFQPFDGVKDRRILRQRRRKQQRGSTS